MISESDARAFVAEALSEFKGINEIEDRNAKMEKAMALRSKLAQIFYVIGRERFAIYDDHTCLVIKDIEITVDENGFISPIVTYLPMQYHG